MVQPENRVSFDITSSNMSIDENDSLICFHFQKEIPSEGERKRKLYLVVHSSLSAIGISVNRLRYDVKIHIFILIRYSLLRTLCCRLIWYGVKWCFLMSPAYSKQHYPIYFALYIFCSIETHLTHLPFDDSIFNRNTFGHMITMYGWVVGLSVWFSNV